MPSYLMLVVLLLQVTQSYCGPAEYYVRPPKLPETQCPGEPCLTLEDYVKNSTEYLNNDTTVIFLHGTHLLSEPLVVSHVNSLTLVGFNATYSPTDPDITVSCNGKSSYIQFTFVQSLSLEGISFSHCGNANGGSLQLLHEINQFKLHNIVIKIPINGGITAYNADGDIWITSSAFMGHGNEHPLSPHISLHFTDNNQGATSSSVHIEDCVFSDGGGSIKALANSSSLLHLNITIHNITTNRSLNEDGDLYFLFLEVPTNFTITITTSHVLNSNGSGVVVLETDGGDPTNHGSGDIRISDSVLSGHSEGGLSITFESDNPTVSITLESCNIRNNTVGLGMDDPFDGPLAQGAAISLIYFSQNPREGTLNFKNLTIEENKNTATGYVLPTVIYLLNVQGLSFTDCKFYSNEGTPIQAYHSRYIVNGTLHFVNNTAYQGGGIGLVEGSEITLMNNTYMLFLNNHAENVGGAIFVTEHHHDTPTAYNPNCFYQLPEGDFTYLNVSFNLTNNTAHNGGDAVYGSSPITQRCLVSSSTFSHKIAYSIFHFHPNVSSDLSVISSIPTRVCLCSSQRRPDCFIVLPNDTRLLYPGQTFSIQAAVVGKNFGRASGLVCASFLPSPHTASLKNDQYIQQVDRHGCKQLHYTPYGFSGNQHTMVLTASVANVSNYMKPNVIQAYISEYDQKRFIPSMLLSLPVYINITFQPCPLGFVFSDDPPRCKCNPTLTENNITCNIADQTIHLVDKVWVNASFAGNKSDGVIVYKHCDNCERKEIDVSLQHPDAVCILKHSGTLCGGCQSGLSLTLGTPQCTSCSNIWLLLLIPFALAGILLVIFISVFDLTISSGTINGLIFYANIVWAGRPITSLLRFSNVHIFRVFLAWLNLDLGIDTCFFDGLTVYWNVWLQFIFPLYVWGLAITVIILSRYSVTASRLFGSNCVAVLATLVYLSYAKLLHNIINILTFTFLDYPDGSRVVVWSADPNIRYLSLEHIPLFIVAVAILLFLWLPYTVILLFAQCLQRMTTYRALHWVTKLKPIFDAHSGPLKDQHRYWVGLLLLVRVVLFLCFAVTTIDEPNTILLLTSVTSFTLLAYTANLPHVTSNERASCRRRGHGDDRRVFARVIFTGSCYKKWYLSLLESSFILNLGILALSILYARSVNADEITIVYVSVGIAFIQFIGMAIFHAYIRIKTLCQKKITVAANPHSEYEAIDDGQNEGDQAPTEARFSELRETLLETSDNT